MLKSLVDYFQVNFSVYILTYFIVWNSSLRLSCTVVLLIWIFGCHHWWQDILKQICAGLAEHVYLLSHYLNIYFVSVSSSSFAYLLFGKIPLCMRACKQSTMFRKTKYQVVFVWSWFQWKPWWRLEQWSTSSALTSAQRGWRSTCKWSVGAAPSLLRATARKWWCRWARPSVTRWTASRGDRGGSYRSWPTRITAKLNVASPTIKAWWWANLRLSSSQQVFYQPNTKTLSKLCPSVRRLFFFHEIKSDRKSGGFMHRLHKYIYYIYIAERFCLSVCPFHLYVPVMFVRCLFT